MRTTYKVPLCLLRAHADINREADEVEEQLRAARARLEADQDEFRAWERRTARERSAGHFFQSLYQADSEAPPAASVPSDEARSLQPKSCEAVYDTAALMHYLAHLE